MENEVFMNSENAIEIRNMSKSFKIQYDRAKDLKSLLVLRRKNRSNTIQVLKDISLDIKKGETVALVGTNGSGKSTLLKLMTKIYYPNSGTIETSGKMTSLLELGAGFHPDFTGRENIYFNASIFGLNEKQIAARIDEIIAFSELGKFIDEPIRTYSSGMYMRLAFSIAINVDAEILLIDEILAVGDQHFQEKCYNKLKELKNSDKTIVIVSHSLEVVKDLCTRAIWIYKGEFRLDGDPTYVIDEYLKQVAIDHREEKRKEIESGSGKYRGIVFIDKPKDFMHVRKDMPSIYFGGWKLCDDENAEFVIRIGSRIHEQIEYSARPDVMEIYHEQFSGLVEESKVGFLSLIDLSGYYDQCDEKGNLKISASLIRRNGEVLAEKDVIVVVDGD